MTTPVCLGIDLAKRSLGLALVEMDDPQRPLWADVVSIAEPGEGWVHEQVEREFSKLSVFGVGAGYFPEHLDQWQYQVARVAIEIPPWVNNAAVHGELNQVFGVVQSEAHRRWPWAPQVCLTPGQWKKATVGKGNAKKTEVWDWAYEHELEGVQSRRSEVRGRFCAYGQDAIDSIAIAVAGARAVLVEEAA